MCYRCGCYESWGMNRDDFQRLAEEHFRDAKALLDAGLYSGAYYMCGYPVECALKACICRRTKEFDFYPEPKVHQLAWSHEIQKLIEGSGLKGEFFASRQADQDLDVNWKSVEGWEIRSRYETHSHHDAQRLFDAISDQNHGVLACIKRNW